MDCVHLEVLSDAVDGVLGACMEMKLYTGVLFVGTVNEAGNIRAECLSVLALLVNRDLSGVATPPLDHDVFDLVGVSL